MLCDNCKKNEANVRYSENINGVKKELNLCEECSQKLGITHMDFSMPIDFSSFFGDFMEDFDTPEFMPILNSIKELKCDNCGFTFEDIANTGKFGCSHCYEVFEEKIDPILKRIQGNNRHVGRIGPITKKENSVSAKPSNQEKSKKDNKIDQLEKLKNDLKIAIKEERYEDAAKLRDEIKKKEK